MMEGCIRLVGNLFIIYVLCFLVVACTTPGDDIEDNILWALKWPVEVYKWISRKIKS